MSRFKRGDVCYFIENGWKVKEAVITGVSGNFYVLKYDSIKGIRLRETRLYRTYEEAWTVVEPRQPKLSRRRSTPYVPLKKENGNSPCSD